MSEWIRTAVRFTDIRLRTVPRAEKKAVRRGLRTLYTMEIMAVAIYRFQMSGRHPDLTVPLIAAMGNEMTHAQDFRIKLAEHGFKPAWNRFAYAAAGMALGAGSRFLGRRAVLLAAAWVEGKAIGHYGRILDSAEWDPETRAVLERDRSDERDHLKTWRELIAAPVP
jgi:demethoxyubiquinone hydroxylase (CLK1/Coq7/Cat5 family)